MKLFCKASDGGPGSGVTGYWFIEWKSLGSVVLLHFAPGSREAYHSHAFNAVTWWIAGSVTELLFHENTLRVWKPSWRPKITRRDCFHKVIADKSGAWALSFRGPWSKTWQEHKNGETYTLTHGRKRV